MNRPRMIVLISIALVSTVAACGEAPQAPTNAKPEATLELEIFVSEPEEINTTSALVMGPTEMMVVEAQGTKSSATRLADRIEETGLRLQYIFLAHPHLDHAQGASVLLQRFPDAQFIATPKVAALQKHRIPVDDAAATARYGDNAAVPSVAAMPYTEDKIYIDGVEIEIWKGLMGDPGIAPPTEPHDALYIPSLNALIPSDIVYFDAHMMMGATEAADRERWAQQIDGWIERGFDLVVPGHIPKTSLKALTAEGALKHSRDYIRAYDKVMAESSSSDEVIAKMKALYPEMQHQSALVLSTWINFREMRKISFNPEAQAFPEDATEEEIAEIDRQRYEAFKAMYNLSEK